MRRRVYRATIRRENTDYPGVVCWLMHLEREDDTLILRRGAPIDADPVEVFAAWVADVETEQGAALLTLYQPRLIQGGRLGRSHGAPYPLPLGILAGCAAGPVKGGEVR